LAFATKHIDRVAAVVLIGGGADLASVYLDTQLTDPASRVRWLPQDPPSEQRDRFVRTWLEACTTDPLHTAAAIPADRVLVIQADRDRIVPNARGDQLWERLGRPERWKFHGGHTLLFWRLDGYATDIASWIDAKVAEWAPLTRQAMNPRNAAAASRFALPATSYNKCYVQYKAWRRWPLTTGEFPAFRRSSPHPARPRPELLQERVGQVCL
jgi:hypothetical protein